jgi:hypothetical protein
MMSWCIASERVLQDCPLASTLNDPDAATADPGSAYAPLLQLTQVHPLSAMVEMRGICNYKRRFLLFHRLLSLISVFW